MTILEEFDALAEKHGADNTRHGFLQWWEERTGDQADDGKAQIESVIAMCNEVAATDYRMLATEYRVLVKALRFYADVCGVAGDTKTATAIRRRIDHPEHYLPENGEVA